MVKVSQSSSNLMLSLKVVLISTSVLVTAVILKLSLPLLTEFALSEIPSIWGFVVSWLRPPYLYVVINCIIITIVVSSKLQQKAVTAELPPEMVVPPAPVKVPPDYALVFGGYDENVVKGSNFDVLEQADAGMMMMEMKTETKSLAVVAPEDEVSDMTTLALATPRMSLSEHSISSTEKPLVSVRIGPRKSVKTSAEGGRSLGVSKPKRHETLESTWKTITEGRAMPLTRHLRKSDTWETHSRVGHNLQAHEQTMTKSETFNHRPTTTSSSATKPPLRREPSWSGKLKKEPSPSQDELNRRVEAFIKKFNEDMRLQRQESLNQYMEMINRGAH